MANVTYLIGAGASAGKRGRDLPNGDPKDNRIIEGLLCVNEIPACLSNLIFDIKRHNFSQEYDTIKEGLLERLEKLYRMSERHATIDTYAKKLKLKKDNLEFQQTEMMLAYFFMEEQLIEALNQTRDSEDINIFCDTMLQLHNSNLQTEIAEFKNSMAQETMPSAPENVTQNSTCVTQNVTQSSTNVSTKEPAMLTPRQQHILQMMQTDTSISASTMAAQLGITVRTIRRDIEALRHYYNIQWLGSSKQGHWQITFL